MNIKNSISCHWGSRCFFDHERNVAVKDHWVVSDLKQEGHDLATFDKIGISETPWLTVKAYLFIVCIRFEATMLKLNKRYLVKVWATNRSQKFNKIIRNGKSFKHIIQKMCILFLVCQSSNYRSNFSLLTLALFILVASVVRKPPRRANENAGKWRNKPDEIKYIQQKVSCGRKTDKYGVM